VLVVDLDTESSSIALRTRVSTSSSPRMCSYETPVCHSFFFDHTEGSVEEAVLTPET